MTTQPLSEAERRDRLEELSPTPRIDDDILIVMLRNEIDGLRAALKAERQSHAVALETVREFKHVCRDAAWMQDEPGGHMEGARLIANGRAPYIRDRFLATYQKLVALAEGGAGK